MYKGDGHYEIWHNSLMKEVQDQNIVPYLLCNKSSRLYESPFYLFIVTASFLPKP